MGSRLVPGIGNWGPNPSGKHLGNDSFSVPVNLSLLGAPSTPPRDPSRNIGNPCRTIGKTIDSLRIRTAPLPQHTRYPSQKNTIQFSGCTALDFKTYLSPTDVPSSATFRMQAAHVLLSHWMQTQHRPRLCSGGDGPKGWGQISVAGEIRKPRLCAASDRIAERSEAPDSNACLFGGAGSIPAPTRGV